MHKLLRTLLLGCSVALTQSAAGQVPDQPTAKLCGTPDIETQLAAHPEWRERVAAIEAQTQRYIKEAGATANKPQPGQDPPLIVIPVVVHVVYRTPSQNITDAVIKNQIEELNLAFRGQRSPGPHANSSVVPTPAAFASLAGDARISFCLATRDANGSATTGITRRDNTSNQYAAAGISITDTKHAAYGGIDAWNTSQYLNIWCGDISASGYVGWSTFPGVFSQPDEDGVVLDYTVFGQGHAALNPQFALGRAAVHEVGHWFNLRHIWGDDINACTGSDQVSDTPNQAGDNRNNPTYPHVSCGNGPDGDMFINHMDNVDDDSRLMFTQGQALRMQAVFGPGGLRESLKSSPGLNPVIGITTQSPMPPALFCGDQTDYRFRPTTVSTGCGGGTLQLQWAATNGWTVTYPNTISYPQIIPNGTSGSVITLTSTYTNFNGVTFPPSTTSVTVGFSPALATPVMVFSPNQGPCTGSPVTSGLSVQPVVGATSYRWTVPPGFTPTGQVTTTQPYIIIDPDATLPGGFYSIACQALATGSSCASSVTASYPFLANGGPLLKIVDSDPTQNDQGLVCPQNRIGLQLVPVVPIPGFNSLYYNSAPVRWSSGRQHATDIDPYFPLEATYYTAAAGGTPFTVTAQYVDLCGNPQFAVPYSATTAPAPGTSLGNGYGCTPNRWRSAPQPPYPNPATGSLQLPGYQGPVVVYNQQGKEVHRLLAPGTDYGAAVDTSTWPDGLYVVTGRSLSGEFLRHNVQVQH